LSTYSYHICYHDKHNTDFNSITSVSFDGGFDQVSSFGETESVYSSRFDGEHIDYGFRWQNVAEVQITMVKQDYQPYTKQEVRQMLQWLTGRRQCSWLTMFDEDGEEIVQFFGRFTIVDEKVADSRVLGFVCTFSATSPFGYSPLRTIEQKFTNKETLLLANDTDDLDSFVRPYITIKPTSDISKLTITNETTNRQTVFASTTGGKAIKAGETITIDNQNMIVFSDNTLRVIGQDMYGIVDGDYKTNYPVWIELAPGINKLIFNTNKEGGEVHYSISYRYPMKVGSTF
jgi:hypothetical protein